MKKSKSMFHQLYKYKVIVGAVLIHFTLGYIFCFPNISMYVISYMKIIGGSNVQYKDSSWVYVVTLICQCFFGFFGGMLNNILGPVMSVLLGGWLMCLGILLSYFTVSNFNLFLITYGMICGIGCGIAYTVPLAIALKKHYNHKGFISGIIYFGRGMSTFLMSPLQNYLVNRHNYMPDYISDVDNVDEKYFSNMEVLNKVPHLFIYEGIYLAILQFIGACLLADSGDDEESKEIISFAEKPYKYSYIEEKPFISSRHGMNDIKLSNSLKSISSSSVLTYNENESNIYISKKFILIWLLIFFNWQTVSYTHVFWKIFGLNYLYIDDRSLSIVGAVAALCNVVGRLFWGYLNDKTNYRIALITMSLSMSLLTVTLTISGLYGLKTYAVWVCLIFFCHSGSFALIPAMVAHTFGAKMFGPYYGLLFTARAFSSIVNALLSSVLFSTVGNMLMCAIVSLCSFLSIMLMVVF